MPGGWGGRGGWGGGGEGVGQGGGGGVGGDFCAFVFCVPENSWARHKISWAKAQMFVGKVGKAQKLVGKAHFGVVSLAHGPKNPKRAFHDELLCLAHEVLCLAHDFLCLAHETH